MRSKIETSEHVSLCALGIDLQEMDVLPARDVLVPDLVERANNDGNLYDLVAVTFRRIGVLRNRRRKTGVGNAMDDPFTRRRTGEHTKVDVTWTIDNERRKI